MTKIDYEKLGDTPIEKLYEMLVNHPYFNIAWKCMERRNIDDPTILHLILEYHEIIKMDNKLNKGKNHVRKIQ